MPFDLKIPVAKVGHGAGEFAIMRWSAEDTATARGPGGLNFAGEKLFTSEQQEKMVTKIVPFMIHSSQDKDLALRPPSDKPDLMLTMRPKALKLSQDNILTYPQLVAQAIASSSESPSRLIDYLNGVSNIHIAPLQDDVE